MTAPSRDVPYPVTVRFTHRVSRGDRGGEHVLVIDDPRNSQTLLEVILSPVAFAACLNGNSAAGATLTHERMDRRGLYIHADTMLVPRDDAHRDANLAALEYDGWRVSRSDYGNPHRAATVDGVQYYRVTRRRFLPTPPARTTAPDLSQDPRESVLGATLDAAVGLFDELDPTAGTQLYLDEFTRRVATLARRKAEAAR